MATSTIVNDFPVKPAVGGWEVAFRVKGLGLTMIVPCDTRKYNLTVNDGAQVFIPSAGGWNTLDGTWQVINHGSYYIVRCTGQTVITDSMADDTYLLNITMTTSLK